MRYVLKTPSPYKIPPPSVIIVGSRNDPYYSKKIRDFCQAIQIEVQVQAKAKAKVMKKKGLRLEERG
jgi:hypothetical protein